MLKKKGKRLLFILVCVVLTTTAGCGNTNKNNTESETYTESEDVKDNTESAVDTGTEQETEDVGDDRTETGTENVGEIGSEDDTTNSPEYTYENISKVIYTTTAINVRNQPSIDGEKIGGLVAREKIQVTGQCKETGWYRIAYNGDIGYVSADYVTEKLPSSWVAELDVAQTVDQMIVVTAEKMGTINVTVSMHTKDENGFWVENYSTPGQIGRNGLGKEKEGDGKTPIGIFTFTSAFGILPNPGITTMPYLQVDETHHWVDDPESRYYNQCVSTRDVEPDWNSTEHLYKYVGDYNYALSTSYNEECVPYVGCAIFLHCPVGNFNPTSGCIAIPEKCMVETLVNLRNDCIIIIDLASEIYDY